MEYTEFTDWTELAGVLDFKGLRVADVYRVKTAGLVSRRYYCFYPSSAACLYIIATYVPLKRVQSAKYSAPS